MNRQALKERARQQLGNGVFQSEWINGVLYMFVASLLSGVGAIITFGPVSYAIAKTSLRKARTNATFDLGGVIDGFKDDFGGTFLLGLLESIFISLWSLLFVIPGIVKSYAYSFAFFVKADHPEYDWKQCLDESSRLTDGHKGELFVLDLSFFLWIFVGALACGVGSYWAMPYIQMTKTNYYLELSGQFAAPYGATYGGPAPQDPSGAPYQPPYEEVRRQPPQQPAYQAPQQSAYQPPQQPAYQPPQQSAYQPPQQSAYQAPKQPAYQPPQQPAYQPPQQPAYQPPQQPAPSSSPGWQRPNVNPYSHQGPVGTQPPQEVSRDNPIPLGERNNDQ